MVGNVKHEIELMLFSAEIEEYNAIIRRASDFNAARGDKSLEISFPSRSILQQKSYSFISNR
jgi:hypothetical protein